jgi:hypothetical protein
MKSSSDFPHQFGVFQQYGGSDVEEEHIHRAEIKRLFIVRKQLSNAQDLNFPTGTSFLSQPAYIPSQIARATRPYWVHIVNMV